MDDEERRHLAGLCQDLVREFEALPAAEVQGHLEQVVRTYDEAPIRIFVPLLAGRQARAELRQRLSA